LWLPFVVTIFIHNLLELLSLFLVPLAYASGGGNADHFANLFLWIAVLLIMAKISSLVEKIGQPAVLGELVLGVILGNLALVGIGVFDPIKADGIILFLAELGVVVLLFQIVVVPFGLGYVAGMWLMPGMDTNSYLFLGATLTATSVGITGRVFRDLNKLQTREAQIVLGAAVIDDVMGLIILAVVSAIVTTGVVSTGDISLITTKAILFLVGALFLGQLLAPYIGQFFSRIHTGVGMKFTIAISFCLIFAYLAHFVGLAPIVGAFAAGLMLKPVYFSRFDEPQIQVPIERAIEKADEHTKCEVKRVLDKHTEHHIDRLIEPLGHFLVPLFFVVTGMQVNLETLFDPKILGIALVITAVAFIGKLVAGIVAGPVNKYIVGWGMAPRGEVGLIFAMIGKQLGVISEELFSVVIIMVILTTLLTPPILNYLLRREDKRANQKA